MSHTNRTIPHLARRHSAARVAAATGLRNNAEIQAALARWGTPAEQARARKACRLQARVVARELRAAR